MRILTHDQLHRTAPAIFANQPDEAVSDRYGFVPTINVVDSLQAEGWYPVRAQQTHSRDLERRQVARHMIRFRQDPDRQMTVGDSVTELVLTNSHDRTAAFQLDLGLFRLVFLNGMVTPVGTWAVFACVTASRSLTRSWKARFNSATKSPALPRGWRRFNPR